MPDEKPATNEQKDVKDVGKRSQNSDEAKAEANDKRNQNNEYEELRERILRLAAEFDNYKKRVKSDIENAKSAGRAEMMKDMLSVLDEFELAINASSKSSGENMSKGFELVYSNLVDLLKKEGLAEIETDGPYDPYKHEILMTKQSIKKEGTILEVVKKGYTFNNVLIRPAAVIISNGKGLNKDDNVADEGGKK
jgi:molecular chaperone GrpE